MSLPCLHKASTRLLSRNARLCAPTITRNASRLRAKINIPPPFPVVESCPAPTCQCREMPSGLDIDREQPLNGTMAAYAEHVLICSGKDDWTSRIENEKDRYGEFARNLKGLLGKGGKFQDPFHNIMVTNSSFESLSPFQTDSVSTLLLPSFLEVPSVGNDVRDVERFLKGFVLPNTLHDAHSVLPEAQQKVLTRDPEQQSSFFFVKPIKDILVLICGHGGRDQRCGVLGPLLRDEFREKLEGRGFGLSSGGQFELLPEESGEEGKLPRARVGLISHIGGHKYAGNVIIYVPPTFAGNPLAGKGIWYGRVGPEQVEGIVEETLIKGNVAKDLFRGGIGHDRQILRL